MSSNFELNIDSAIEYVKNIYENSLCVICGKSNLPRMRFTCGHSACENCITTSLGCYTCLTSSDQSFSAKYDPVLTQQVKTASFLVNTFQETFNIDVFKRKRLSEQQKIEKELFPQCIQAPLKYYNKRKSYSTSNKNKEYFSPHFLGENISPVKSTKMEDSINSVQNWFNKNDRNQKRKPLADINLDNTNIKRPMRNLNKKAESSIKKKSYENKQRKYGKRTKTNNTSLNENQKTLHKFVTDIKINQPDSKITKKDNKPSKTEIIEIDRDENKDESGVIEDATPILIEDSQLSIDADKCLFDSTFDKDRSALLEVLEADKKYYNSEFVNTTTNSEVKIQQTNQNVININQLYKVPYYKMGYLQENCYLCSKELSREKCDIIDNNAFKVNIQFSNVQRLSYSEKNISKYVQTDNFDIGNENIPLKDINVSDKDILVSKTVDLQTREFLTCDTVIDIAENIDDNIYNKRFENSKNVIIEESDSSEDMEESRVIEVIADIHRSYEEDEYDILTPIENIEEHKQRSRRRPRGHTPDSSNSSDKENYDPNRAKKSKNSKKNCYKK